MAKKRMNHTVAKFGVSASVIARWKARLTDGAEELFEDGRKKKDDAQVDTESLFTKIGKMEMIMKTMEKNPGYSREDAAYVDRRIV